MVESEKGPIAGGGGPESYGDMSGGTKPHPTCHRPDANENLEDPETEKTKHPKRKKPKEGKPKRTQKRYALLCVSKQHASQPDQNQKPKERKAETTTNER